MANGTYEATSLQNDGVVLFRLKMNVVVDLTLYGVCDHVGGNGIGNDGFDITAVAGQTVLPAVSEVADVADPAAGRDYLDQGAVY